MKHSEFNIPEMYSNSSNGKTSIGKTHGSIIILAGIASFVYSAACLRGQDLAVVMYSSTGLIAMGAALIMGKILRPTKYGDNSKNESTI